MVDTLSTAVAEVWRQVLPPGSQVVAGETGLAREVTWAATLRLRPPAFAFLGPGEIALLASDSLPKLDPPLTLAQVVESLSQQGVAAVGVVGDIPAQAQEKANALGIPLLGLPQDTNLSELEGAICRFITRQRSLLHRKGAEIHRRLMEASIEGTGLAGLLRVLSQAIGRAVALLDGELHPRHLSTLPGQGFTMEELGEVLSSTAVISMNLGRQPSRLPEPPVIDVPLGLSGHSALACPVLMGEKVSGYLLVLGKPGELGALERVALVQASSVFASEMAKERAVVVAESRLRGDFLERLLKGELGSEEDLLRRARHLGYDMTRPYVAMVLRPAADGGWPGDEAEVLRILKEALAKEGGPAAAWGNEAILLLPAEEGSLRSRAEVLRQRVMEKLGGLALSAGVGRFHPGLRGLQQSYQEAKQALTIGRDLLGPDSTVFFDELGVYPVLFPLRGSPEVRRFLEETLGPLWEYDERNSTELVKTLETYFSQQGNLSKAAAALHLHRNSLSYRLRRLEEVAGVSLQSMEDRFRLQLALRLQRLAPP
jgi:purine catabolism regulator